MQEFPSEVTKFDFFFIFRVSAIGRNDLTLDPLIMGMRICFLNYSYHVIFYVSSINFFFFHCEVTLFTQQRMSHASDICIIPLFACRPHMAMGPHARRATN